MRKGPPMPDRVRGRPANLIGDHPMAGDQIGHARTLLRSYRKGLEERITSGLHSVVIRSSRDCHPFTEVGRDNPRNLPMPPLPGHLRGKCWGFQWGSWSPSPSFRIIFFGDSEDALREDCTEFAKVADPLGRLVPPLAEAIRAGYPGHDAQGMFDEAANLTERTKDTGHNHVAWIALAHSLLCRIDGTGRWLRRWAWDERLEFKLCPIPYREADRVSLPESTRWMLTRIEPVSTVVEYSTLEHNLFLSSVLAIDELLGMISADPTSTLSAAFRPQPPAEPRGNGRIPSVAVGGPHPDQRSGPPSEGGTTVLKDKATEDRDAFIYEEGRRGTPWAKVLHNVNERPGWSKLATVQSVRNAAARYAERHRLPLLSSRKKSKRPG
jgi:hypothetical protein